MNIRSDLGWEKYLKPFLYKRLPDGTGWSAVLGTMCALTFMLLVVTGMILAFYYVPSPDKAWDSVQYISNEVPLGNIVRGLHHWSAGLMVLLVFCHLMVTYMHGSYAAPRQITWLTGVCLFLVTLGLGFTGYLLPWDMKAYWATVVGANSPNQYPGVGNYITRFILGGNDISGFTLTRFYSVHTLILPACLLMLMAVHIYLIRVHNLSDPRERLAGECLPPPSGQPYRFYPEHTNRTTLAFGCIFVGLLLLASYAPPHMEARAGTFIPDYLPRPEWYYMWLFQLLTFFTGSWEMIGSLILFGGGLFLLFGVPFFSESKLKGMGNRPVSVCIASTFVISIVYLTVMAYADAAPYKKFLILPDKPMSEEAGRGMFLYAERECSYCHNILGQGGHRTGPDMSNMVKKGRSAEYLADYIKNPLTIYSSSTMPAYDLTPEQLKDLSAFLLSLDFSNAKAVKKPVPEILETSRAPQASPNVAAVPGS